ncbi:MAG: DUF2934 domain-containing protein [SAR202 cluster bacterium]|nr:DUF2934 domain-containing protein [SAR202 cluster bacterium]
MPAQREIEQLAYTLWERAGHPHGQALEHYLTAERILREAEQVARAAPAPLASLPMPRTETEATAGGPAPSGPTPKHPRSTGGRSRAAAPKTRASRSKPA